MSRTMKIAESAAHIVSTCQGCRIFSGLVVRHMPWLRLTSPSKYGGPCWHFAFISSLSWCSQFFRPNRVLRVERVSLSANYSQGLRNAISIWRKHRRDVTNTTGSSRLMLPMRALQIAQCHLRIVPCGNSTSRGYQVGAVVRIEVERFLDHLFGFLEMHIVFHPHVAHVVVSFGRIGRIERNRTPEQVRSPCRKGRPVPRPRRNRRRNAPLTYSSAGSLTASCSAFFECNDRLLRVASLPVARMGEIIVRTPDACSETHAGLPRVILSARSRIVGHAEE